MKNSVIMVLLLLLILAGGVLVGQRREQSKLRLENESLRQQLNQLGQLQADNEQLSNQLAQASAAAEAHMTELLKLRGEAASMRNQTVQITELQSKIQQLNAALAASRNAQLEQAQAASAANANTNATFAIKPVNLGHIQLVNQAPKQFELGGNKMCTLTATIEPNGNYDIKAVFATIQTPGQPPVRQTVMAEAVCIPGQQITMTAADNNSITIIPIVGQN